MDTSYNPGQGQPPTPVGQYDFITNPAKSPKGSLFGGGKNGILAMIIGGLGLLTIILLLASVLFGGTSDKEQLLTVAQKQSEVIAIAQLGADDGGTNQAKSFALAVDLAVTTEQQAVVAQISKDGKIKEKDYAAAPNSAVVTELETAQLNGRFDEVFVNVMKQELTEYQRVLQAANSSSGSQSTKELLARNFDSASLLMSIPQN